ncbi:MAG: hypothetical protein JNL98_27075 [Bryobacterales bacterium]|nr:hypothetical protein [Bryobacterales bacterium]
MTRLSSALHALGLRFSRFWLGVIYYSVAAPFGLLASRQHRRNANGQPVWHDRASESNSARQF